MPPGVDDPNDACLAPHRNARVINTMSVWQARHASRSTAPLSNGGGATSPGWANSVSSPRRPSASFDHALEPDRAVGFSLAASSC